MAELLETTGPPLAAARRYFDAWNRRDPEAIAATFAEGGTYSDPTTEGDLTGPAIAGYAAALVTGFPDLSFEIVSEGATASAVAAEWVMRGTNTGPLRGAPPTGASVALPGADVITVEDGAIRSVRGYFDRQEMLQQLGLKLVVQPPAAGPVSYGTSAYVQPGRPTRPGAVSLTWIDARSDAEALQIQTTTRQDVVPELARMPGFISTVLARAGDRLFTISAWESSEAAGGLMRSPGHRSAMQRFFRGELGSAVHTGVWVPERLNVLWVQCPSCAEIVDSDRPEGTCACGEELPRTPLW